MGKAMPIYKRIVIKMSGEALSGTKGFGLDWDTIKSICQDIKEVVNMGVQVCIVVGGGNIWRGRSGVGMDRVNADYMGMLATVINAMALQDALEQLGVDVRVQTAIEMKELAEPYIRRKAISHLNKGRVVIFGFGTGNPYFTTDSAAALRAAEMEADVILSAKNVDGVYDSDPNKNASATMFCELNYIDVLDKGLKVIDSTAVSLCMDNNIPIHIFGLSPFGNIQKAVCGEKIGTIIKGEN